MRKLLLTHLVPLLLAAACAKKTPAPDSSPTDPNANASSDADANANADGPSSKGPVPEPVARMIENFKRVHFEFDKADLSTESREALSANAEILLKHPSIKVEIEGHADDRGTSEYNLSLGERRARAVQAYLVTSGVAEIRIPIISYGEEKPVDEGGGETAWSQNRRAEFKVTWGQEEVRSSTDPK
ncbi:MAG: peptidoglycan-associated lipoprotein Pal [Deltaproteobacteria bacterium]|nr:peptidoglycan-associated lipoprotein Pal [Deltaproteobacteria bacterium]